MEKKREYAIKRNKYMLITLVICILTIVFLTVTNISYDIMNQKENEIYYSEEYLAEREAFISENKEEANFLHCIYLEGSDAAFNQTVLQALERMKIGVTASGSINDISEDSLKDAAMVFLAEVPSKEELIKMESLLRPETSFVFLSLDGSAREVNEENDLLLQMMGIIRLGSSVKQTGIRLLDDFLLGGRVDIDKCYYTSRNITLSGACKIYMRSYSKEYEEQGIKNEELTPLIWRNIYQGRKIFTVNGDFIKKSVLDGVFAALLSKSQENYIYPAINSIAVAVDNFPYYCNVKSKELTEWYSRDAEQLQIDILLSDLLGIVNNRDLFFSFYDTSDFGMPDQVSPSNGDKKEYYNRMIAKTGCQLYHMNDRQGTEERLIVPAVTGFYQKGFQVFDFYSAVTAYGGAFLTFDMKQIIFPESKEYDWVKALKSLQGSVDQFLRPFNNIIPSEDVSDAEIKARIYQISTPEITYGEEEIYINTGDSMIEYSFFLRTNKEVEKVENGTFRRVEDTAYLITLTAGEGIVYLKEKLHADYES